MSNRNTDSSQGDGGNPPPPPGQTDNQNSRAANKIYKSGPLFLSSRGIGWTSWKKRWFILTRTSLVFFRSDPSAVPQKGGEVNLTLGGIDLNSSGSYYPDGYLDYFLRKFNDPFYELFSVVVKADKKLLTVLFPDGRDGRAFTLKAETSEDLYEWKAALEEALANAPSGGALAMGQNGIFKNDQADGTDGSFEQSKDKLQLKSVVIGQPVLLALEEIDGTPTFLEKALRFIEEHGVKVEGILRQAADVDDVERRIREYEQGKTDFSSEEDAHVIGDCIKYVLRELPSSPVPASCCNSLLEACRTERGRRVAAVRSAICETFPEPNRRLLQRILMMMQSVASHKAENRMSSSAVAACMAPLLLRSFMSGECVLENDFDMLGDSSVQLMQAAAAANHAQAIVITLLEEYDNIFGESSMSPELYSDSEMSGSEGEELSDDDEGFEDDEYYDETEGSDVDEGFSRASSETCSETAANDNDRMHFKGSRTDSKSHEADDDLESNQKLSAYQHDTVDRSDDYPNRSRSVPTVRDNESGELLDEPVESSSKKNFGYKNASTCIEKSTTLANGTESGSQWPTVWGRTTGKKKRSMGSIDVDFEDEAESQKPEVTKSDLPNRTAEEAKENPLVPEYVEKQNNTSIELRRVLEQDVARLKEQLKKESELRAALEAELKMSEGIVPVFSRMDKKMKAELEEIALVEADIFNLKQKIADLGAELNRQREQNQCFMRDSSNQKNLTHQGKLKAKHKDSEATATSSVHEKSTRSKKDTFLNKIENDNKDTKQEASSLPNKNQQQQPESVSNSKPAINHRKAGTKGEGANATTSALSKLTNRLNFLKERRNQITSELLNYDKGRNSGQTIQKHERGGSTEDQPSEQDRVLDSYPSPKNKEKGVTAIDNSSAAAQNLEKDNKRSDAESLQNPSDKGRRPEGLSNQNLDRGKSECSSNVDKGRTTRT